MNNLSELDEEQKKYSEIEKGEEFQNFLKKWGAILLEDAIAMPNELARNIDLGMMFWAEHDFILGIKRKGGGKKHFGLSKREWLNLALNHPGFNHKHDIRDSAGL